MGANAAKRGIVVFRGRPTDYSYLATATGGAGSGPVPTPRESGFNRNRYGLNVEAMIGCGG